MPTCSCRGMPPPTSELILRKLPDRWSPVGLLKFGSSVTLKISAKRRPSGLLRSEPVAGPQVEGLRSSVRRRRCGRPCCRHKWRSTPARSSDLPVADRTAAAAIGVDVRIEQAERPPAHESIDAAHRHAAGAGHLYAPADRGQMAPVPFHRPPVQIEIALSENLVIVGEVGVPVARPRALPIEHDARALHQPAKRRSSCRLSVSNVALLMFSRIHTLFGTAGARAGWRCRASRSAAARRSATYRPSAPD